MVLVDDLLQRRYDTALDQWLTDRRQAGFSYDRIARELESVLEVDGFTVTYQTVRRWCIRLGVEPEEAAE